MNPIKKVFELAFEEGLRVKLIYMKDEEVIERIVKPTKLYPERVLCYDYFRKQTRSYAYDKMLAAERLPQE